MPDGGFTLKNTVIAQNRAAIDPGFAYHDIHAQKNSDGFNLIGDIFGATAGAIPPGLRATYSWGDALAPLVPHLHPLAYNDGFTRTAKPIFSTLCLMSHLVDKAICGGKDQRGVTRPIDMPTVQQLTFSNLAHDAG